MKVVKSWWQALARRQKSMIIVIAVVFALVSLAGIAGMARSAMLVHSTPAPENRESGAVPAPQDQAGPDSSLAQEEDPAASALAESTIEFDANGMALMPVTKDPREAAAGAAAVASSVRFAALERQEFLDVAIERMTQPAPNYVGPREEIHTLVESPPFGTTAFYSLPPAEVLHLQVDAWGQNENPDRYTWWTLANGAVYDNFTLLPDHYWRATPTKVLSEEQVSEIDASLVPTFPKGTDMTPDTKGASLTHWWVLSDVENSMVGTADASTMRPAYFAVWCDAPEDGGLCAVAYTLDASFPAVWPRQ